MKKILILTVIAILAVGAIAMAATGSSVKPTCHSKTLKATVSIYVKQGFEATATGYDATFCGPTGFLLAGMEAVNAAGGASNPSLKWYGRGPYSGPKYTSFTMNESANTIANDDLVLAALTVMSNYNKVNITIDASGIGVVNNFGDLKIVVSDWDNDNWSNHSWVPSNPYFENNKSYTTSGDLTLTQTPINSNESPYAGFLFIYTVYNGSNLASNYGQQSNQIAPWVEAGKYSITFKFTISPVFTF